MKRIFKKIILLGRPASGKSEIIDYLKKTLPVERLDRFHIGNIDEIDDFPMLWTWFEEDAILEKILKMPRMHSTPDGYFLYKYQWHLLIERICMDYSKKIRDNEDYHSHTTCLIEFSRGSEHGGYREAFKHPSSDILTESVVLYVNVPFEESLRKNRKRFNPDKPDSILEHGLPDSKLERLYKDVDWDEIPKISDSRIRINGFNVPYVIFENMPSKTDDPHLLGPALDGVLNDLWNLYKDRD
jgi:hypothetical protein